jgi:hypothetical protein
MSLEMRKLMEGLNQNLSENTNSITITIPPKIQEELTKLEVLNMDDQKRAFEDYINHLLGTPYGIEAEQFSEWFVYENINYGN